MIIYLCDKLGRDIIMEDTLFTMMSNGILLVKATGKQSKGFYLIKLILLFLNMQIIYVPDGTVNIKRTIFVFDDKDETLSYILGEF